MAHIFATAVSKISKRDDASPPPRSPPSTNTGGRGGVGQTHQPGVAPPLSPQNLRDEEIELTSPKAVAPRPASPVASLKRSGSENMYSAADKGKARAFEVGMDVPTFTSTCGDAPELHRAISTSTSFAMGGAGAMTPGYEEADPLLLRSKLVDESDLRRRPTKAGRKADKDVKKFYEDQNEHIERLLKPMHAHTQSDEDDRRDAAIKVSLRHMTTASRSSLTFSPPCVRSNSQSTLVSLPIASWQFYNSTPLYHRCPSRCSRQQPTRSLTHLPTWPLIGCTAKPVGSTSIDGQQVDHDSRMLAIAYTPS